VLSRDDAIPGILSRAGYTAYSSHIPETGPTSSIYQAEVYNRKCTGEYAIGRQLIPQPPLHVNSLAYGSGKNLLAVAGPDGFLCVMPARMEGKADPKVFEGHVGDVLDVKFFPSGEVSTSPGRAVGERPG
jgi:hypothetical protein